MEITVEIGTPEEQELIQREMELFTKVVEETDPPLNISKIFVPMDFDAKVNELQGTTAYKSVRGVMAVAKIVNLGDIDGFAVVISPYLYTEYYDSQTRIFIYIHEIFHIANKRKFPTISVSSDSLKFYLDTIYILFDEYVADRKAYECVQVIFDKTEHWKTFIQNSVLGFVSEVNDPKNYAFIKSEIESFRWHGDVPLFQKNISESFDNISKSIVHTFSLVDHDPSFMNIADITKSPFVSEKTLSLMRYFNDKYQAGIFDLHDGVNLIKDFVASFGMKYEDKPLGMYLHVLDI